MASSLGSLIVDISANVAKFTSDMDSVRRITETNAQRMNGAFSSVLGTLKAIGEVTSAVLIFDAIKQHVEGAIEAAAGLERLSQRTGATVEGLANLSATAKLSNTDNDQLAQGLQKLSKSMIDAANGGVKTSAAFQAIGISTKDIAGQRPDEIFRLVAQRLGEYQDGAEKVALAQLLMGKSGANMLPLLHDLAEGGEIQSRVTAEQAKQAEEFEKNLKRLSVTFHENANAIVQQFLPALSQLSENMLAAQRAGAGLLQTLISIPLKNLFASITDTPIQERIDAVRASIARLEDAAAHPYPGQTKEGLAAIAHQAAAAKAELAGLLAEQAVVAKREFVGPPEELAGPAKPKIQIRIEATTDEKALRDAALKDLDRSIAIENAILTQREQFLTRYYNEGKISLHDYYAAQQASIDDNLRTVQADYAAEIAAAEKYATERRRAEAAAIKARGGEGGEEEIAAITKLKDARIGAEEKVRELQDKSAKAASAADIALKNSTLNAQEGLQKEGESVEALNIELLKLTGHLEEAAAAQAKLSLEQLPRQKLGVEGDAIAARVIAQKAIAEDIATGQKRVNDLETAESIIEQRVALQQQTGAIGQLEGLAKIGAARRDEIAQLEILIEKQDELAARSGNQEAILKAQELHLKLEQLKADADPLAAKFENMFETAFADNFAKVIDGTESIRKAFSNMANSIFQELSKIAAQDIAKQIFGAGGAGAEGGFGGFLSGLFGGRGGSGLAAGQAGPPANLAGGGGLGGLLASAGSFFSGFLQEGGPASAGNAYLVGERGPELFMPGRSGTVIPAGGFGSTVVHVHMPPGQPVTRESMALTGAAAARAIAVSHRRNN